MIHNNSFKVLRIAEFLQQGKDLSKVISDSDPNALGINKQLEAFSSVFLELEDVFKTSLKNPLTQTLVDLDSKRDDVFMGMCSIVDGYLKHWTPSVVAQAASLVDSINVYGRGLTVLNYQAESSSLSNLIESWEKDTKLTAALTALNLESWKNELKTINNLFIQTYTNRSLEDGKSEAQPKIKALREQAIAAWNKLQRILLGKVEEFEDDATKAPKYNNLVNSINGVLDSYNNLIQLRQGRKAAKNAAENNATSA